MNVQEIIKEIKNNGGITINTSKKQLKPLKNKGYMVSFKQFEKVLNIENKQLDKKFTSFLQDNEKELTKKNRYIGGWIDSNKLYLDIVTRKRDKKKALELGKKEQQIAIFDLKNCEVVQCNL